MSSGPSPKSNDMLTGSLFLSRWRTSQVQSDIFWTEMKEELLRRTQGHGGQDSSSVSLSSSCFSERRWWRKINTQIYSCSGSPLENTIAQIFNMREGAFSSSTLAAVNAALLLHRSHEMQQMFRTKELS